MSLKENQAEMLARVGSKRPGFMYWGRQQPESFSNYPATSGMENFK